MMYLGDYKEDLDNVDFTFNTHSLAGVPTTLSGTPVISCYKGNSVSQETTGITLTVDFDGVTGLNHVRVDLSAHAFYAPGIDYFLVITTGTVDGVSVVGVPVAHFSIEFRYPTPADNADAVLDEPMSGHVAAGTAGVQLGTDVDQILTNVVAVNTPTYAAKIDVRDNASGSENIYIVNWFKNMVLLESGVTSPTIWVFDHDGNDHVGTSGAPAAMTEIGTSESFKYEATGGELMTGGEAYTVHVNATIDGSTRKFREIVGRDSSA
jgi:hypothetical protein